MADKHPRNWSKIPLALVLPRSRRGLETVRIYLIEAVVILERIDLAYWCHASKRPALHGVGPAAPNGLTENCAAEIILRDGRRVLVLGDRTEIGAVLSEVEMWRSIRR